jgi:hypothetical protein
MWNSDASQAVLVEVSYSKSQLSLGKEKSRKAARYIDGENRGASERREDILRDITRK